MEKNIENILEKKINFKDFKLKLYSKTVKELKELCSINNIYIDKNKYIKKNHLQGLLEDYFRNKFSNKKNNLPKVKCKKQPINGLVLLEQGKRDNMEDTYVVFESNDIKVYGVFDGHGGDEVSTFLSQNFVKYLIKHINNSNFRDIDNMKDKIEKCFIEIDDELNKLNYESGSTAIICLMIKDYVYMINLGDSRGILFSYNKNEKGKKHGKMIVSNNNITIDHKPDDINEFNYIKQCNGRVEYDNEDDSYRVNGDLAMSRAFGDFELKYDQNESNIFKGPVSCRPDIICHKLNKNKIYSIILASDGLWDIITNKRCLGFLDKFDIKDGCKVLMKLALQDSWDNITILTTNL